MTDLPEWLIRYKEFVALSPADFKLAEGLEIAWQALEQIKATPSGGCSNSHDACADDAMRRITEVCQ